MTRVFVTGMGVISPLGVSVSSNRDALREGRSAISTLDLFSTRYAELLRFGEIKIENQKLKEKLRVKERGITRTTLLALHAFEEAIKDSGLSFLDISSHETSLIGANTVGGMCLTDELYHDANQEVEGSEYVASYDSASIGMYLQEKYGIKGIINTINTACSSSANAIIYGARLIKHGYAKRAIVGGVDSLAKFTINGFNSLHILSSENCKPFDRDRNGLNLGEGAAFLVLEGEEEIGNKKVYAELTGYNNSNDAYHASSLSETADGPFLAMKGALEEALLSPSDINFINAHGTGTENNDEVESTAMIKLFKNPPAFASTKSNIGHTLGASGAIEAIYSILNIEHQEIYPGLNFRNPIPGTALIPTQEYTKTAIKHVMSNSFGFGGNCSSLIFSKTS